ncbi:MAG: protein-L-isoaspartate(D-aspartate) O-methyltransferase [Deltaproteobacteria bacterium]|nr:protein-L-isoaspartate(D-aspartate) O-methyltransferase [Deltaproteobacteria bacterium]NNG46985.1 protein-L-isoaspartate(D-aspartate) O-methyltransferase [Deltaproteobacteria bacterium]
MRSRRIVIALLTGLLCIAAFPGGTQEDPYLEKRMAMVRDQIEKEGVSDPRVLAAMREVPRHLLVPLQYRRKAYEPRPLPIGAGQTISQPYVVAFMTEILRLKPGDRVLEVGTGSGYQAAVAAKIAGEVYTVEIFPSLADRARRDLASLGLRNITVRQGDGYYGWKEKAPFDAIIVTCAGGHIPPPLVRQLRKGGRMIMPVGGPFMTQNLVFLEKGIDGALSQRNVLPVVFVRLLGH